MNVLVAQFRAVRRWDVKYYEQLDWAWPAGEVVPFGKVAVRRVEPVDRCSPAFAAVRLASIHFDGSITLRQTDAEELKGRLFYAYPGDLVFSKIDVRNGAIGVIPDELGIVAFTSEYPVYDLDAKGLLRADFVKLLCRTKTFRSKVNALVVGHSGRKRVSPELMESLPLPAPPLHEQERILASFRDRTAEARALRARAEHLERSIPQRVLDGLGITPRRFDRLRRPFLLRYKDAQRWSLTKAMLTVQGITEEVAGAYPTRRLGESEISTVSYGIQKSPENRPGENARPYLRVANVQEAKLDLTVVKMIDVPDEQMPGLRLEDGDLLLCEGNSEELVGRPAIWHNEIPNCVHQNHIIKVRVNRALLDPEYVLAYMNTPPARLYFLGRAKRTTNLASINGTDVREMPLPVPPLDLQRTIVGEVTNVRAEVRRLRAEASNIERQALSSLEQAVLGTN